jgi:pimeloyl-ACP methyl ester carboxylesterase
VTMAACVEEVAAVRDGLGLDPFHVLGHSGGRLARPRVRPKPPEGLAGGRSCQVTVVRVASSPVGALPFGRSREGAVWRCRAPTLMYATSPWVGHLASFRLRWHFLRRQTMIAHSEPVEAGETLSCASTAPATSWGATAPTWRG